MLRTHRLVVLVSAGAALLLAVVVAAQADSSRTRKCCDEQRVSIPAGGYSIPGVLTLPKAGGAHAKYPTVLMLHGTASQKDEVGDMYNREAQKLAAVGVASLRIDFAGSGDSTLPQTAFTYTEEVADTKTALTWLSSRPQIDAGRLGLLGFSQGGRVASTVAGTDARVKAVTTWSTWSEDGSTAYLAFGPDAYAEAQQNGQVTVDLGFRTWTYSLAFFDSIKSSHPLQDIAGYHGPLLGIDGTDDYIWPQTKDLLYAAGSYDETFHAIPGADHIYHVLTTDQTEAEDVLDTTAAWFAETFETK
jgi:dienelactone hydrolase